jgi:hypothetical protein
LIESSISLPNAQNIRASALKRIVFMKHVASNNLEVQLFGLSTLVQLEKRARHAATVQELVFIMVNETHSLVPYRQAVLWQREEADSGRIAAISGTPVIERNAPFTSWLSLALAKLDKDQAVPAPRVVDAKNLPGGLGEEWREWLPAHGLWIPLVAEQQGRLGALFFAREQPWTDGEQHLLQALADAFAHAWASFRRGRRRAFFTQLRRRRNVIKLGLAATVLIALFLPISLSVLAPAEVVALQPAIVRAPVEGVVDHFEVRPNEPVKEGQLILELDRRAIENKLEVASKALAVAEAEYRQAAQQAVFDDKVRAQLAVLKGRADQRRADVIYAQSLLERVRVTAPRSGIALFADPNDWIGRPVTIGERLLEIADPNKSELEIWLPVADAITLNSGAEVDFFLNVAPDAPLHAKLRQTSYEAVPSPSGVLGYRLKAELTDPASPPRIGLRGTAKIYGDQVSLFYYLIRRPLAAARQLLGF